MSLLCRLCGERIKFDDKHISERTGKRIPLDVDTEEPHNCTVWSSNNQQQPQQQTEKRYHQCRKGCGQEIYFDANHSKSQSGKWIPLTRDTGLPHQCQQQ
jgi:hypothetical protein